MTVNFYMSCGHWQEKDCSTTGEQFRIDKQYYATQGLCDECWKKLIERRKAEREEMKRERTEDHENTI